MITSCTLTSHTNVKICVHHRETVVQKRFAIGHEVKNLGQKSQGEWDIPA